MPSPSPIKAEHSQVTVGIVTYNSATHIQACLDSIAENLKDAVPTVSVQDNDSWDGTQKVLKSIKKKYPFLMEVISNKQNEGYAAGINRIVEMASTDWLCFINPDARLLTPAFQYARTMIRKNPVCGVIGGILVDPDGEPQESGGVFPTPLMAVWDWCGLRHIFPLKHWSTTLKLAPSDETKPRRIDYPTGAFWMLRREVYTRVGNLDERFFLYFEETDFCRRASQKKWPSFIHPGIKVEHYKGASFERTPDSSRPVPPDPLSIYFESLVKYLRKHFPAWRVNLALGTIRTFLKLRKWIKKDEKSERILKTFVEGEQYADDYERNLAAQDDEN